jgi:hypothetical protein
MKKITLITLLIVILSLIPLFIIKVPVKNCYNTGPIACIQAPCSGEYTICEVTGQQTLFNKIF